MYTNENVPVPYGTRFIHTKKLPKVPVIFILHMSLDSVNNFRIQAHVKIAVKNMDIDLFKRIQHLLIYIILGGGGGF